MLSRLDPEPAWQYLETLHRSFFAQNKGFLELRFKPRNSEIRQRFYPGPEAMLKNMTSWEADCDYWVGVAPRSNNRSGKKKDCAALSAAFADVDAEAAGHKEKIKYQTKEEALAVIEAFPLRPSLLADSGGGFQLYWLLLEPVALTNGNLARMEHINRGLAMALGGDVGASDASRILRLPGTFNMKLAGNPRPVKVMWCEPDRVYNLADFSEYEALGREYAQGRRKTHQEGAGQPADGDYAAYAQKAMVDELAKLAQTPAHKPGRNNQLNKSAKALGELVGAGVLDRGSVEAALHGVAVSIGLTETEIRATIRSGIEAGLKDPRKLPERPRSIEQDQGQKAEAPKTTPAPSPGPQRSAPIRFVSGKELEALDFPEPVWVVPEILPEGLCLLSARPKKGKTWVGFNISVAKSTGGCALRKAELRVTQGKVLYLCLEDKLRRAQKRLKIILGDAPFPEDLILAESWPRLDKGGLEPLQEFLKEHSDCRLVVVDSYAKIKPIRPKNADPYEFDMAVGGALQSLAQERHVCILLIYHNRKTLGEDPIDDVIGSTGLTGAVDAVLVLRRGRGQADATLFITGRDVEEQELALKFHPSEGLWELMGAASEYAMSQERQEILSILRNVGPKTVSQLANILGKSQDATRMNLARMKGAGILGINEKGEYQII
jgi:hypothetical protein